MLNIIGNRKIFLTFSAVLVIVCVAAVAVFGFRQGIDFKGGTLWNFKVDGGPAASEMNELLGSALGTSDVHVSVDSDGAFLARLPDLGEDQHQKAAAVIQAQYSGFQELSFQSIGPSVGASLRNKAIVALILVLAAISLYIAFAFRKVFQPVSSWKYGWITLLTLLHDVAVPAGVMAALGHYLNVEIDTNFLVALLVVMGFSVHDTIVVFDRIRENLLKERAKGDFEGIVNRSINQTLARSINTSLTLILVLVALYAIGPAGLHYFVLTLLIGVITGIYSSIFVASPMLIVWQKWSRRGS
ncbi:MAG: protein-export membrane protein SecF [Candidatus Liptonbacteria bacterium RIFCSPHIGHO2_01_FULL_57_28]|uniref:Protein-export membrane protein SecF n=1 Tax=Candidatus Liptonbacteria bacterium RIFCSPHIGHO2_01_FULL_57_28 TaxID=1798647 RepID=A0A1G2CBJ4_9BACT|nr:MAG: protein-export membrane protein SecF [Candidatus Liptonbacteria bacterium RIFCSPHIGHO2_01_FULL_57_28]